MSLAAVKLPMAVTVVLCDADGCLFPSEEPAFAASVHVTNRLLARLGSSASFTATELRQATTGQNFRATATALARANGVHLNGELERWVERERAEVTDHLAAELQPDPAVTLPLRKLARDRGLGLVSSSARSRIEACLAATGLEELFPPELRFSAEDDLPEPTSKPDPAVYSLALERLGIEAETAIAVEDSVPGVLAAVAAGVVVVGNLKFVVGAEREQRTEELISAGAAGIVDGWGELARVLAPRAVR